MTRLWRIMLSETKHPIKKREIIIMKQFLIILRGAPASGKSTIAKRLCNFENKIVWLRVDLFKKIFNDEKSEQALNLTNESALVTLAYLLDQGLSVVMEGVFQNSKYVEKARQTAEGKNIKVMIYEFICPPEILIERDKNRKEVKMGCRPVLPEETIEKLADIVAENPVKGAIKIDTDSQSPAQIFEVLNRSLAV